MVNVLARLPSLIVAAMAALCAIVPSQPKETRDQQQRVTLVTLASLSYPSVAQVAHITGDMVLTLQVKADGTVESAIIDRGPALDVLRQAVLESANHSRFDCRNCGQVPETVQLIYSFVLEDPASCTFSAPKVTFADNHVTVVGHPIQTCDPSANRIRSLRCLYLWRCRTISQ
jgi:hypothetical protein